MKVHRAHYVHQISISARSAYHLHVPDAGNPCYLSCYIVPPPILPTAMSDHSKTGIFQETGARFGDSSAPGRFRVPAPHLLFLGRPLLRGAQRDTVVRRDWLVNPCSLSVYNS